MSSTEHDTFSDRDGLHAEPLAELFRRLTAQIGTLIRQEKELAQAELSAKGREFSKAALYLGLAAVLALCALGAATALLILALDGAMPNWAAALVTVVLLGAVATGLAILGKQRLSEVGTPLPEQAIDTTKEDVRWAKTQLQSGRR